jgi:hypothetical protein
MSFKTIEKKDCWVNIPEVGAGSVSVLVFYPGIDISSGSGKVYMPPLIKKAVPDWYDKFVIVIPFQHTRKWSSVKSQYEEEMTKANLQTLDISLGIFSGSGNGSVDIMSSMTSIKNLKNFIMMDPSASSTLAENTKKVKAAGTIVYLMYNADNWGSYKSLQAGFKPLEKETQYKEGDVSNYFDNVQQVKSSHMVIPTEMLVFYKERIGSYLSSPILGPNNPTPAPPPPVVYKVYCDMGGVLFEKNSSDEGGTGDSQAFIGAGIWERIKKYNPTILSAVGSTNKDTIIANKKAQIKANLKLDSGEEPASLFVDSGPGKDKYAEKTAILIDDSKENIDAWVKKGGIGIKHDPTDALNGVKNTVETLEKIIGPLTPAGLSYSLSATGGSGGTGGTASPPPTIQMFLVFPENFVVKAREDVPDFTVWVGPIQPEEPVEGFTELFSDDESSTLSENEYTNEYIESEFAGEEEIIEANASQDDEPMGDYYYDDDGNLVSNLPSTSTTTTTTTTGTGGGGETSNVSVESSPVGPGPPAGSKLITGSGKTWYIGSSGLGIAGHRLKPILGDLQKHLRANGYPTAVIGNNGITRDLVASVYPNSPARAVASLHGAGLAIDVTFKIDGKKWSGIGDNKNLANDPQLTKVIWNFVKNQGDITWGAQYSKSDPANGIVKDRGITEYHHFEITSNKIANYWKPYESDLKAMGFDYKTLTRYGRDSPIYKVMKQLLASKGIS